MLNSARQSGFNLIEAMVTLSVLGLLIATALPDMSSWMHSTAVRAIAETTEAGLQKARAEAIARNKVVTFWLVSSANIASPDDTCSLSSSSAAWVVSLNDPSSHCGDGVSSSSAPYIVQTYGPGSNAAPLTIAATDGSGNPATSVSFNGYGQQVGTGAVRQIDIQYPSDSGSRHLRVQVSPSGSVRLCDADVAQPDPRACN